LATVVCGGDEVEKILLALLLLLEMVKRIEICRGEERKKGVFLGGYDMI